MTDPGAPVGPDGDGVEALAALLGVPPALLGEAIGGPWGAGTPGPAFGHEVTVFTGLENPRVPGRPLVVLRLDHDEGVLDVGRAVGVSLPGGAQQWSLGEPRASLEIDEVPLDEAWGASHSKVLLLEELHRAVAAVLDSDVLRGTTW